MEFVFGYSTVTRLSSQYLSSIAHHTLTDNIMIIMVLLGRQRMVNIDIGRLIDMRGGRLVYMHYLELMKDEQVYGKKSYTGSGSSFVCPCSLCSKVTLILLCIVLTQYPSDSQS